MIKLVFCNGKGGVGKSSCAFQIGSIFSYIGKRILLIDCDSQNNLSTRLRMEKADYFLEDLLLGKCKIEDVLRQPYPDDDKLSNMWVLPSSFNLSVINDEDSEFSKKYAFILSETLKELEEGFDICILDTNPAPSLKTNLMAYCYSDYIIGVLDMCTDSVKGFNSLIDTQIQPIQEYINKDLKVLGVVMNNYDARSSYAKKYLVSIQERYGDLLFNSVISFSAIIPQSSAVMLPLIVFESSSKLTTQFIELGTEILRRIKQGGVINNG